MPYHPSDIKILFVLSNKDPANISSVAAAYFVFTESIPDVVIEFASIHGGVCPYNYNLAQDLAQDSNTDIDPRAKAFALDDWEGGTRLDYLKATKKLSSLSDVPSRYAAALIFGSESAIPDDFAPGLPPSSFITTFLGAGKYLGALGGGVMTLCTAEVIKGEIVSCPASLQTLIDKVRGEGGTPKVAGSPLIPDLSISHAIITGANAVSAQLVAQALVEKCKDDGSLEVAASM